MCTVFVQTPEERNFCKGGCVFVNLRRLKHHSIITFPIMSKKSIILKLPWYLEYEEDRDYVRYILFSEIGQDLLIIKNCTLVGEHTIVVDSIY